MNKQIRFAGVGAILGLAVVIATVVVVNAGAAGSGARKASNAASRFSTLHQQTVPAVPQSVVATFKGLHPDGAFSDVRAVGNGIFISSYQGTVCGLDQGRGIAACTAQLQNGVFFLGEMIREWDSEAAPFEVHLDGLAADGVSSIVVGLKGGQNETVPVSNNGFSATLTGTSFDDIASLNVLDADGTSSSLDPRQYFPSASAFTAP